MNINNNPGRGNNHNAGRGDDQNNRNNNNIVRPRSPIVIPLESHLTHQEENAVLRESIGLVAAPLRETENLVRVAHQDNNQASSIAITLLDESDSRINFNAMTPNQAIDITARFIADSLYHSDDTEQYTNIHSFISKLDEEKGAMISDAFENTNTHDEFLEKLKPILANNLSLENLYQFHKELSEEIEEFKKQNDSKPAARDTKRQKRDDSDNAGNV